MKKGLHIRAYLFLLIISLLNPVLANNAKSPNSKGLNNSAVEKIEKPLSDKRQKQLIHLIKQDCGSCHGMTLKGGLGPSLLPSDLTGKPRVFIENTILMGRPGTAMPPWKDILTKQEIHWISIQLLQGLGNEK